MRNIVLAISVIFLWPVLLYAKQSDSTLITMLIKQIDSLQYKQNSKEFYKGMFRGYRECGGRPHNYVPDNNIFFTAVTAFGLKHLSPYLKGENKKTADDIVSLATTCYPNFKNQYGYPYYGFWGTHAIIMPHSIFFKYLKSVFGQGEDADDTVMILLADNTTDSTAVVLKKKLIANGNITKGKRIISTYKEYRNIPAYSTWLGDRMTPDFDFAVQCNIMYFVLEHKLQFTRQDTATIQLLADMVKNREYMRNPIFISPYYVHPSVLLYHITRLMGTFKIPALEAYKQQLVNDINSLLPARNNVMEQIILRTSLLRLGAAAPDLDLHTMQAFDESNQKSFVFFQARAAFSYPVAAKEIFLRWSYIYYLFYCPAYNRYLWLEYLVLKNRQKP